jgi:Cu/Ag efflux pump CusA
MTDLRAAVLQGASERLAPILMTAMSTGLALIPIAMGLGKTGSEIHAPLAIVVLFGLFSSTALNMVVVPAIYAKWGSGESAPWLGSLDHMSMVEPGAFDSLIRNSGRYIGMY